MKKLISVLAFSLVLFNGYCYANDKYACQDSELLRSYKVAVNTKDFNNADDMLKALRQRHKGLENNYEYAHIFSTYASSGIDAALIEAEKVAKMYPDRAEGYFWLGYLHLQNENFKDSIYNLKRAKRIEPKNIDLLINLVYSLFWSGRDRECLSEVLNVLNYYKLNVSSKVEIEDIVRTHLMGAISAVSVGDEKTSRRLLEEMISILNGKEIDNCCEQMLESAYELLEHNISAQGVNIPYVFDKNVSTATNVSGPRYGYEKPAVGETKVDGGNLYYPYQFNSDMPKIGSGTQGVSVLGAVAVVSSYNHYKHHHYHRWHHR